MVGIILWLIWIVGFLVSWFMYYQRAGLAGIKAREGIDWREFLIPNPAWFLQMWGKCSVWPVVLVVWLAQDRPDSQWRAVSEINGQPARTIVRVSGSKHGGGVHVSDEDPGHQRMH
jgi:hypothetical protein